VAGRALTVESVVTAMIPIPNGVKVWIATGHTDNHKSD